MSNELAKRAVACERWEWRPGMWTLDNHVCLSSGNLERPPEFTEGNRIRLDEAGRPEAPLPDLDDDATKGAVLGLVREAWGKRRAPLVPYGGGRWAFIIPSPLRQKVKFIGDTEKEALVAALEAAPAKEQS